MKPHIALKVRNVERSLDFYRRLFDEEPSQVSPGYAKFDLASPPLNFTLNESAVPCKGSLAHLGIQLSSADEVASFRSRWANNGLSARTQVDADCDEAARDKIWVVDPDGNEWEAFAIAAGQPVTIADQVAVAAGNTFA